MPLPPQLGILDRRTEKSPRQGVFWDQTFLSQDLSGFPYLLRDVKERVDGKIPHRVAGTRGNSRHAVCLIKTQWREKWCRGLNREITMNSKRGYSDIMYLRTLWYCCWAENPRFHRAFRKNPPVWNHLIEITEEMSLAKEKGSSKPISRKFIISSNHTYCFG